MNYIVIRNHANEIVSTRCAGPCRLTADALAIQDADENPVVELWGGNESGPLGAYPVSTWMNGKRIYS